MSCRETWLPIPAPSGNVTFLNVKHGQSSFTNLYLNAAGTLHAGDILRVERTKIKTANEDSFRKVFDEETKGVMVMRTLNLIAISFLCAATLLAQGRTFERGEGRRGRGMHSEALNNYLNLTEQQVADLQAARRVFREETRPLMEELHETGRALREEMGLVSPNPAVIGDLTVQLKGLRDQIKAAKTAQREQILGLLTEEQRGQVEELERVVSLQAAAHQAVAMNFIEGPERGPGMRGGFSGPGAKGQRGFSPRGRMRGLGGPPQGGATPNLLD